jgi:5-formyltetrahydrofolate cyclo-ligase
MFDKKLIRKRIIELRDSMNLELKEEMDREIFNRLVSNDIFKKANIIFSFVSFGSEVDTRRFIEYALSVGKTICVPKVISMKEGMEIRELKEFGQLKTGFYGVQEPNDTCRIMDREEIDLILMPGVAFDRYGGRIGYGGGFYDRFLTNLTKKVDKIAVAYEIQIVNRIKTSEHDVNVDMIITEKEIITSQKRTFSNFCACD